MTVGSGVSVAERYTYQSLHWGFPVLPVIGLVVLTGPTPTERVLGGLVVVTLASWAGLVTLHTALRDAGSLGPSGWDRFRTAHPRPWLVVWLAASVAAMAMVPPVPQLISGPEAAGDDFARLIGAVLLGLTAGILATPALVLLRRRWPAFALAGVLTLVALWQTAAFARVSDFFSVFYPAETIALLTVSFAGMFLTILRTMTELDRARQDSARLAVAEERLRFSRDLHDVFGRTLSAVALKAELAAAQAERGRPEAAGTMREVQRIATSAAEEVRTVVRGYRDADLAAELAGARALLEAAGIDVTTDVPPTDLPGAVRRALAWVVREGATNVLRHADATRVSITLTTDAAGATLAVRNDRPHPTAERTLVAERTPVAEPVEAPSTRPGNGGSGLAGLAERLAEVGGSLATTRADGHFTLTAHVDAAALARLAAAEGGAA